MGVVPVHERRGEGRSFFDGFFADPRLRIHDSLPFTLSQLVFSNPESAGQRHIGLAFVAAATFFRWRAPHREFAWRAPDELHSQTVFAPFLPSPLPFLVPSQCFLIVSFFSRSTTH